MRLIKIIGEYDYEYKMRWTEDIWKRINVHLGWKEVRRGIIGALWWLLRHVFWLQYLNPLHYLYLRYQRAVIIDSEETVLYRPPLTDIFISESRREERVLSWASDQLPTLEVCDLSTTWCDGIAICALLEAVCPGACPRYDLLKTQNKIKNCRLALRLAHKYLGIPQTIITPEEMALEVSGGCGTNKMMSLLTLIKASASQNRHPPAITHTLLKPDNSLKSADRDAAILRNFEPCTAKGTGLVAGVVGKMCKYNVFMNTRESLDLRIEILGPENDCCLEKILSVSQDERRSSWVERQGSATINFLGLATKKTVLWKQNNGIQNPIVRETQNGNTDDKKQTKIPFDYQCISEGHILITFIPRHVGIYLVRMHWHNKEIRGSPFSVNIVKSIEMLHEKSKEKLSPKKVSFGPDSDSNGPDQENKAPEPNARSLDETAGGTETAVLAHNSKIHRTIGAAVRLTKQATITRRRVLRRVITKAGQEIVIHEAPSYPGSPNGSPSKQKPGIPDRPGSPAPQKLHDKELHCDVFDSEVTSQPGTPPVVPMDEGDSLDKLAVALSETILKEAYTTIEQMHQTRMEEASDSSSDVSSYVSAPETTETRRDSLQPPQFDINFSKGPFASRQLEEPQPSRGHTCEEKRAQFKKEKDSEGSNMISIYEHENVKRVIATRSVTMNPSLNFNQTTSLGIPEDETLFKSSPFSRSNSPFGRGRRDDDSESCTSESDSVLSFDVRSNRRERRSPLPVSRPPSTVTESSSDVLEMDLELGDSFHYLADIEEKLRMNIKNEQEKKSLVTVRTQIAPESNSEMSKHGIHDTSDDSLAEDSSNSMGKKHYFKKKRSLSRSLSDPRERQKSVSSIGKTAQRLSPESLLVKASVSVGSEGQDASRSLRVLQSESLRKSCYLYNHDTLGVGGDSSISQNDATKMNSTNQSGDTAEEGDASDHMVRDGDDGNRESGPAGDEHSMASTKTKLTISTSLPIMSRQWAAFEFDPDESVSVDEMANLSTRMTTQPKRASFASSRSNSDFHPLQFSVSSGEMRAENVLSVNDETCDTIGGVANDHVQNNDPDPGCRAVSTSISENLPVNHDMCLEESDKSCGPSEPISDMVSSYQANGTMRSTQAISHLPMEENETNILNHQNEENTLTIRAPKAKVSRHTQVTYSEIKSETGWDKSRAYVPNSQFLLAHTSPPHTMPNVQANVQKSSDNDAKYLGSERGVQACMDNEYLRASQLPMRNARAESILPIRQSTVDTIDSGIQDDRGLISPLNPFTSPRRSYDFTVPVRQQPTYLNGHRIVTRCSNNRHVPIDSKLLSPPQTLSSVGKHVLAAPTEQSFSARWRASANRLNRITMLHRNRILPLHRDNNKSLDSKRVGKLRKQYCLNHRRVTFSRRIMVYQRSSSRSSRNSSGKRSSSNDSFTFQHPSIKETENANQPALSLSSKSVCMSSTGDAGMNEAKARVSFTDQANVTIQTSAGRNSAFQLMSNTIIVASDDEPTASVRLDSLQTEKVPNAPSLSPVPSTTLSPKSSASLDESYRGFGVPYSQRDGLLSELNFFRNLDEYTDSARLPGNGEDLQNKEMSSSSDTCSEVAGITQNLQPVWPDLGSMEQSTQHIDIAAWLDSAIASSSLSQDATPTDGIDQQLSLDEQGPIEMRRPSPTDANTSHRRADAAKCQAFGAGLHSGLMGTSNNFQVRTDDAGHGNLSVSLSGTRQYDVIQTDVIYTGDNLYEVIYEVKYPGTYIISVKWSEVNIPGSPFVCSVKI